MEGLILVEPRVFPDDRGYFFEGFHVPRYEAVGISETFVQDNISWSKQGVLRGLHYQIPNPQGKLVQVLAGEVFDVAVDLRRSSPTFGKWQGFVLSDENHRQLLIPAGFAHGFLVLRGPALLNYKCTSIYESAGDTTLRFDDPDVGVAWPVVGEVLLSSKDREGLSLSDMPPEKLFP